MKVVQFLMEHGAIDDGHEPAPVPVPVPVPESIGGRAAEATADHCATIASVTAAPVELVKEPEGEFKESEIQETIKPCEMDDGKVIGAPPTSTSTSTSRVAVTGASPDDSNNVSAESVELQVGNQ
jgi:hypothetical protein